MCRISVCTLVAALSLSMPPPAAAQATAAASPQTTLGRTAPDPSQAAITGTVVTPDRQRLAGTVVRARNLVTGEIGGSTTTAASGGFVIDVDPGRYVLEVVGDGGLVIATSLFISAEAGATV